MSIQCIDRRCTVDVHTSRGYSFEYGGKTHRRKTKEGVHNFFLKEYHSEKLDTVKLHINHKKYYLHFTLDEPEKLTSKRALRSVLAKENGGAWVEEKNGKHRYFIEKGWLFSNVKEVSEEEFSAPRTSGLMQTVTTLALGALSIGSSLVHTARRLPATSDAPSMMSGLVGFSLLQATPTLAQMPAFGEFRINTNITQFVTTTYITGFYSRSSPKLTGLSGGGFVAAWMSYDQDGSGLGIYGQIYDATGFPAGSEFRINTNTTSDQEYPTLAGLTGGGFAVAWQGDQTGDYDIYGQRYDASGAPVGSEFLINTNTTNDQQNPTVAALKDGGFVAAWESNQDLSSNSDIYGQRYDYMGLLVGGEFLINTYTASFQLHPTLAGLIDGGYIAAWESNQDQSGYSDIYSQKYNAVGLIVGSEFRLNTNTTNDQLYPTLAALKDGGFVAAWQSLQNRMNFDIYGQRYDVSGFLAGSEFRLNTNTTDDQLYPTLAALIDGGFVAAWQSLGQDGSDYGIYGQRYNATGLDLGSEFSINTNTTSTQEYPTLAALMDGGFVAAWASHQNGIDDDIYGQRYDANGAPVVTQLLPTPPIPTPSSIPSQSPRAPASAGSSTSQGSSSPSGSSIAQPVSAPNPSPSSNIRSPLSAGSNSAQSSPTSGLISITNVSYGIAYAIYVNGVSVGTFEITGGTGLVSGNLSNTLTIHLDASTDLGQGPISLFTFSSSQGNFQSLVIMGDGSTSCRVPEGTIVQDSSGQSTYQAIYTTKTCTTADAARPASAFFTTTMLKV